MANFCKQCSIDLFGEDFGDLSHITTKEEWNKGLARTVICERCGYINVDPNGKCVSEDCLKKHGKERITIGYEDYF